MATTGQHAAIGVVSATKGEVFAKGADGQMRRLAVGDQVFEGDVIVTANGSSADITPFNGPVLHVQEQQTIAVDAQVTVPAHDHDATAGAIAPLGAAEAAKVIQTVGAPQAGQDFNAALDDEATAAGLTGGDGAQGGHNFVDLMRIVENVPMVGYDFPTNPTGTTPIITGLSSNTPSDALSPASDSHNQIEGTSQSYTALLGTSRLGNPVHIVAGTYVGSLGHSVVVDANGTFTYTAPVGDERVHPNEVFTFKTVDDAGSTSTSTVTINIIDTAPLANNDYGHVAITDHGQVSQGNVMLNDIANVDTPPHVTAVNGHSVAAEGSTPIDGTYGTLIIDANGEYSYSGNGPVVAPVDSLPFYDNVAVYGMNTAHDWSLNVSSLGLGSSLQDGDGVAPLFLPPFIGGSGFGVDGGRSGPMIDSGESLIFSLDHAASSVTVSLGGLGSQGSTMDASPGFPGSPMPLTDYSMAHWYAYGENGALIGDGNFGSDSSLTISETTAIKTLVVHNDARPGADYPGPSFYVTGVGCPDVFTYTLTDSDGSHSNAQLVFSPSGVGMDLTAANGGHVIVGTGGDDVLQGGAGNDVLSGGGGFDTITGGEGANTFVWHLADVASSMFSVSTITDFKPGDVLELNDLITPTADVTVHVGPLKIGGTGSVVTVSDSGHAQTIFLEGYTAANPTDMANQLKSPTHSFTG